MTRSVMRPILRGAASVVALACAASRPTAGRTDVGPAPSPVRVLFVAAADTFAPARDEYARLWAREGARIVATMERVAGRRFDDPPYADTLIRAIVFEGVSESGYRDLPMKLRASYPEETKRATLVHELGHRLQTGVVPRGGDEHGALFLWLYDTWVALWGREFADRQVAVERRRRGPYPAAWDGALALDSAGRAERWRALRDRR